jgi:O-antigen/teichoic acid export membrane protein
MTSIKKNIVANLVGKVWGAAIALLLIPQYIKYLGIESYGLIGFYSTLSGSLALLDLGLSITLNRELAKLRSQDRSVEDIRDLTFSLERIYWLIGIVVCFIIFLLSGFIANHWVNAEALPLFTVKRSIMLMGVVFACQWPISLYSGGLTGLDKQVFNNVVTVIMTTLRAAGVILILAFFSPTLQVFFLWQAAISFLYVIALRWGLWNKIPPHGSKPRFSSLQLKIIWRFAAGMTGISFITFFITQVDKIILSKILPLSQFGYYTLAFTIANSVSLIVQPISLTFFPRFTHFVAIRDFDELKKLYHHASRLMSTFIFPVCFVLLFFTKDILIIWTKNSVTAENTYRMAQILIVGSIFNSLMVVPFNLLLANGRTKFTIYQNSIAVVILIPMLFIWTNLYGAIGATFVWVAVNAGYVFISQPIMHKTLLQNELKKWYFNDTLVPMLPSLITVICFKVILQYIFPTLHLSLILLACISMVTLAMSLLNMPSSLKLAKQMLRVSV